MNSIPYADNFWYNSSLKISPFAKGGIRGIFYTKHTKYQCQLKFESALFFCRGRIYPTRSGSMNRTPTNNEEILKRGYVIILFLAGS